MEIKNLQNKVDFLVKCGYNRAGLNSLTEKKIIEIFNMETIEKEKIKKTHLNAIKEFNDRDREEIARLIKEGFSSGILDDEENGGKKIVWELKINIF